MVSRGKEPTYLSKRVGHVVPGVVVNLSWAGWVIKEMISIGTQVLFHLLPRCWITAAKSIKVKVKISVGRSTTVHNLCFCPYILCMNYETNAFLLVSSSVRSKQLLCSVQGQSQKREQKHTTKNCVGFHNHSPLLTMALRSNVFARNWQTAR